MISENHKRFALFSAWLIALIAMLMTLYSSEVALIPVCHLCWYQRICIYPLSIILAIAVFHDDRHIYIYAIPLAVVGAFFALYQYLIQMIPNWGPIEFCTAGPDCRQIYFQLFGFINYPFLSLLACLLIIFLLFLSKNSSSNSP